MHLTTQITLNTKCLSAQIIPKAHPRILTSAMKALHCELFALFEMEFLSVAKVAFNT